MLNALTIDVEDYYQVSNFEHAIHRKNWDSYPSRVVASTEQILRILDRHATCATFFVLGYVADRHPQLVRDIAAAGHEIGSHSYWHRRVNHLSEREFRDDLRRSRETLEQITGQPVNAFRAPSFSITKDAIWALDVLIEEGYEVDSSLLPGPCTQLGHPEAGKPFTMETAAGSLKEFPLATSGLLGLADFPICGGGYFRLMPLELTCQLLKRQNQVAKMPFTFYTHPWEFDPQQPKLNVGSPQQRFRHYVNLSTTKTKFEKLLSRFDFGRMDAALKEYSLTSHEAATAPVTAEA